MSMVDCRLEQPPLSEQVLLSQEKLGKLYGLWQIASLVAWRRPGKRGGRIRTYWQVACKKCGDVFWILSDNITAGYSTKCRSCSTTKSPHYHLLGPRYWAIMQRCYTPHYPSYKNYGARGIQCTFKTCEDFVAYIETTFPMKDYSKLHIDRIDNNGDYAPGNLRVVPCSVNAGNKSTNVFVEYKGLQVLQSHLWHLLKTDYPDMQLGPIRTTKRLAANQPWQEIIQVSARKGGRKSMTLPMPDPGIVSRYRTT